MSDHPSRGVGVVESRLKPPAAPAVELRRHPLRERLLAGADKAGAVVLLCAPAGYGKTVLLRQLRAELLGRAQLAVWLSIDPRHQDPAALLAYLQAAAGAAGLPLPPTDSLDALRVARVNHAERQGGGGNRFFDELERLRDPAALAFIDELLGSAGPMLRVLLGSRQTPPLRLAKLLAAGRLIQLGPEELAFSFAETGEFLLRAASGAIGVAGLNLAYNHSLGWPGVLKILVQSAGGLEARLKAGQWSRAELHAYFEQEVLAGLTPAERELVDLLALTPDADAVLLQRVLGRSAPLQQLAARWPAIRKVDPERYGLHPLLQHCVATSLQRDHADRYVSHCRALAAHYRETGDSARAIDLLIDSGDHEAAITLLENEGRAMTLDGMPDRCVAWIARLPRARCDEHPNLLLAEAWAHVALHDVDIALQLLRRAETLQRLAAPQPVDEAFRGEAEMIRATAYAIGDDHDEALAAVERIPAGAGGISRELRSQRASVYAWHEFCSGRFTDGLQALFDGACFDEEHQGLLFYVYCSVIGGECYAGQGLIEAAEDEYRRSLKRVERLRGREAALAGVALGPLIDVLYETDRLDEALALSAGRTEQILKLPMPGSSGAGPVSLALAMFHRGAAREADELLERMTRLGEKRGIARVCAHALAARIWLALRGHQAGMVPALLGRLGALVQGGDMLGSPAGIVRYLAQLALLRTRIADGEDRSLLPQLSTLQHQVDLSGHRRLQVQIRALHAAVCWRSGRHDRAVELLSRAIVMGHGARLIRSIADEMAFAPQLIGSADLFAAVDPPYRAYLQRLIAAGLAPAPAIASPTPPETAEGLSADESGFTAREREILYLIARGLAAKHIARTLGISTQTAKWHLKNIYQKLGVHSRTSAVVAIQRLQLRAP